MKTTVDRLLMNLRGYKEKAFALLATSYKGSQANGATLVICDMPYSDINLRSLMGQDDRRQKPPMFRTVSG